METQTAAPAGPARELLEPLGSAKARYAPADRETKVRILQRLRDREIRDIPALILFHEILCFLRAYPDGPDVLRLVEEALEGFAARVDLVKASGRPSDLKKLQDTGIVHTTTYYPFPYAMAQWLVERFPRDVELDWDDEEGLERIGAALPLVVAYAENDALDDERVPLRDWVKTAKGKRPVSDLQWLLEALDRSPLSPAVVRTLYDGAQLLLGWELRDATASRTLARFPARRIFYHTEPLLKGQMDFWAEVRKPLPTLASAPRKTAEGLIHLFRAALSVRRREFHPLLHANPRDVLLADAGRGLTIVLVGVLPDFRLPLEGYYSFLVLKNGVPVSYGGAAPLLDRLEFAGNIFESFRQGESIYLFSQVFRVFRQLCGARYFLLPRYQVGYENDEALKSGAFWFYHKLGFRPEDPDVLRLSEEEHGRIKADPAYRSSPKTLKRLARSDMAFSLGEDREEAPRGLRPGDLGLLVTRQIAQQFNGDRAAAVQAATGQVARGLGISGWRRWSPPERAAMERLAPIVALIPDLPSWRAAEKRALTRIIQAKGGRSEAAYIRLLHGHPRLARSLRELANSATLLPVPTRQTGPMSRGPSPGV